MFTIVITIIAILEAGLLVRLYLKPEAPDKPAEIIEKIVERVVVEPEIPEDIQALALLADPYVEKFDKEQQGGEWKFHQAYAAMLKDKAVKGTEKWKIGLAIHIALAQRRTA